MSLKKTVPNSFWTCEQAHVWAVFVAVFWIPGDQFDRVTLPDGKLRMGMLSMS